MRRPGIVLLLSIRRVAVMLSEELRRVRIAAQLHVPQLGPGPIRVQISRSDEGDVDTQVPVNGRAVYADEYAIGHAGPCRVLCSTVEACLEGSKKSFP